MNKSNTRGAGCAVTGIDLVRARNQRAAKLVRIHAVRPWKQAVRHELPARREKM